MPDQRVVAAPEYQQRFSGGSGGDYAGGGMIGMGGGDFGGLEEQVETEMSSGVKKAVEAVDLLTDEEKKQFTSYMLGLAQED
jgi:hypothetical protein